MLEALYEKQDAQKLRLTKTEYLFRVLHKTLYIILPCHGRRNTSTIQANKILKLGA